MERARLGPCREHRSQSDTTAMEVASLRHQYNKEQLSNYLSPKLQNRPQRGNSSVSSKTDQAEQVSQNFNIHFSMPLVFKQT